ncbi:MAG TPA: hypothetical protein DFR83_08295 [Deltaproteobacteria bacterium]|nr:hypothetical protein [Deltaproteobacteria bacterium]
MRFEVSRRRIYGFVLIALSFVLWGGALASPFMDADLSMRAGAGLGFYGLSYVAFGFGCKMVGDSLWPMIKRRFWPGIKGEAET